MSHTSARRAILCTGAVLALGSIASAEIIEVESFHLGGFYAVPDVGLPLIPDNDMSFQNYFMGHTTVGGFTTTERRTFFAFDLSSVIIPDGEMIVSVEFELELLFGGILANMSDGFEAASFTSTTSDYLTFADPLGSGLGPDEIFDSMGTGEFYTGAAFDDMSEPGEVTMAMSAAAIFDMETSIATGSSFMITGKMDTYDPDPGALFEFMFGLTDVVVGGSPTGFAVPKLIITTAPIPAPASIAVLAGGLLIGSRRRR
ncbi:MAG: hypothetical protein JKX70_11820 [Phycisphaerales bacterium]|nr:hypothetical protein [Phycisphaerales bacterium]